MARSARLATFQDVNLSPPPLPNSHPSVTKRRIQSGNENHPAHTLDQHRQIQDATRDLIHVLLIGKTETSVMTARSTRKESSIMTTVAPLVIRPGRSTLRNTFQLKADVLIPDGGTPELTLVKATNVVLDWLAAKFPQKIPASARNIESFELDHHGQQQLLCVSVPEEGLWSARLLQPDAPFRGRPAVAGRTWTTEVALHRSASNVQFAVRVLCASAPYATEPIALTRPRIVIDIANLFGLRETRVLDGLPWILKNEDDLYALHDLLTDDRLTMPVVLLTQPQPHTLPGIVSEYLLNHKLLAQRIQGFAHVVCMPKDLGYSWTRMVGKVWSAFSGAVRTYQPGLDFENDSPFAHPRTLPDRIVFWRYNGKQGEEAFASFLIDKMQEHAAAKYVDWGNCKFFVDARSLRASYARDRIKREVEEKSTHKDEASALRFQMKAMEDAHDEAIAALNDQIRQLAEERDVALQMGEAAENERERVDSENRSLQIQNDVLRTAIESKSGKSADLNVTIPDNFEDMPDWVEQYLTGRLILHPRALQGIKKAQYKEVKLVYQSLLLLAREYRNKRLGHEKAEEEWVKGQQKLRLRFGASITKTRAGEHGQTYFVQYPIGTTQSRFLENHLRKGSTKDDRYCLGIYFFWDDATRQVVVGWLPSHLDTRAT